MSGFIGFCRARPGGVAVRQTDHLHPGLIPGTRPTFPIQRNDGNVAPLLAWIMMAWQRWRNEGSMRDLVITNACIVTADTQGRVISGGALAVAKGRIA